MWIWFVKYRSIVKRAVLITFPHCGGFLGIGCRNYELSEHVSQSTCTRPTWLTYVPFSLFKVAHCNWYAPPTPNSADMSSARRLYECQQFLSVILLRRTSFNFYYVRSDFSLSRVWCLPKINSIHFAKLVIVHLVHTVHNSLLSLF